MSGAVHPQREQHHFIVAALLGLTFALAPIMLVIGALDAWIRNIPAAIAFEIAMYIWIVWMFRNRFTLSTRAASMHFVAMMIAIGVITGWWYVNDPLPFLYLITAIPIAGILLGFRGFVATAFAAALGLLAMGVLHTWGNPEVFNDYVWMTTSSSCMIVGSILGGAGAKLNEALLAVPDPVTIRDYRRERELEIQLALAEKDRALGGLARAVAHDFNNLLTPIMASAETASLSVDDPDVREDLSAIMLAGKEARQLVRTILEFQRDDSPVEQFDLGEVVERVATLVVHGGSDDVEIVQDVELGMHVSARTSDIQRILLNLVTNARRATVRGQVRVRVAHASKAAKVVEADLTRGTRRDPVEYAMLEVEDEGIGMSADCLRGIFDPFVTHSGGTGLGLSTVEEIVNQLGGYIEVWSTVGEGTRFRVHLPLVRGVA